MSLDKVSVAIVAVVLAVTIVTGHSVMGAVDETMQQQAGEWCEQRGGDLTVAQTNWGTSTEYLCTLPNGTVVEWLGITELKGGTPL